MKNLYLFIILVLFGVIGFVVYQKVSEPIANEIGAPVDSSTTINNEATKTKEEAISELIQAGSEHASALIKDERAAKRERDSIHLANRQPIWICQIGGFRSDAKDFAELHNKLTEAGISNLYIMKKSRNSFYLVKNDNCTSQEDLGYKLSALQDAMKQADIREDLEVKNLHSFCDNDDAVPDGDVKVEHKVRVECYSCK